MDGFASIESELRDPATPQLRLGELVAMAPEWAVLAARHPNAYPELLEWIAGFGDPTAQEAARRRLTGQAAAVDTVNEAPSEGESVSALPARRPVRTPVFWGISIVVCMVLASAAAIIPLRMIALDAPSGSFADGTEWGADLGAIAQRYDELGGAYSFSEMSAVSPAGDHVYVVSEEQFEVLDAAGLTALEQASSGVEYEDAADSVSDFLLSPAGEQAYAVRYDGSVRSHFIDEGHIEGEAFQIGAWAGDYNGTGEESLALSPDGSLLYVGLRSETILLLDAKTGERRGVRDIKGPAVAVNPVDGSLIVGGGNGVTAWQLGSDPAGDVLLSSTDDWYPEKILVSTGGEYGLGYGGDGDGANIFFDPSTLEETGRLPQEITKVWDAQPLDGGKWLLVLGVDEQERNTLFLVESSSRVAEVSVPLGAESRADFQDLAVGADAVGNGLTCPPCPHQRGPSTREMSRVLRRRRCECCPPGPRVRPQADPQASHVD